MIRPSMPAFNPIDTRDEIHYLINQRERTFLATLFAFTGDESTRELRTMEAAVARYEDRITGIHERFNAVTTRARA